MSLTARARPSRDVNSMAMSACFEGEGSAVPGLIYPTTKTLLQRDHPLLPSKTPPHCVSASVIPHQHLCYTFEAGASFRCMHMFM